ncbi:MAG: OsmC family protein [Lentimicrobiaceae bacterium]
MADLKFRIKAKSENPTKTIVKVRGFEMILDEPADLGGTNSGANPVEYLLTAYAGCLNVMGHIVANEMKIELQGIELELTGSLNPDRLFGKSFEERAGYKEITVVLKPNWTADEATTQKWVDSILDRCPVGDNLKNNTKIVVAVKQKALQVNPIQN